MARDFDGSSQYLYRTDSCGISAYPFTMSAWVNADSFSTTPYFFQFGNSASATRRFGLAFSTSGHLWASANSTSASRNWATSATLSTGVWGHCAGTFYGSVDMYSYLNGVSTGTLTLTGTTGYETCNRTGLAVLPRSSFSNYLNGRMAEAAIWNVQLTDDEIARLANGYSPLMVRPESLVAYWPLFGRAGSSGDEEGWIGATDLTQQSSPILADHPRIIYPSRKKFQFVGGAAAAGVSKAVYARQVGRVIGGGF